MQEIKKHIKIIVGSKNVRKNRFMVLYCLYLKIKFDKKFIKDKVSFKFHYLLDKFLLHQNRNELKKGFLYSNLFNIKKMYLECFDVKILYEYILLLDTWGFLFMEDRNIQSVFKEITILFKKLKRRIDDLIYKSSMDITNLNRKMVLSYNCLNIREPNDIIKLRCVNIEKGGRNEI